MQFVRFACGPLNPGSIARVADIRNVDGIRGTNYHAI